MSRWAALALAAWCCAVAAVAGELPEPLRPVARDDAPVDARVGLGGVWDCALPVPVVLTVDNRTGAPIDGEWRVETIVDGETGKTRLLAAEKTFVASPSVLRRRLCLRLEREQEHLLVSLVAGNKIFYRQIVERGNYCGQLGDFDTEALNLLFIGAGRKAAAFPVRYKLNENYCGTAQAVQRKQQSHYWSLPQLPPVGLRRVDGRGAEAWELPADHPPLFSFHAVACWEDADLKNLTQGQAEALAEYVRAGGCLVLPQKLVSFLPRLGETLGSEVAVRLEQAAGRLAGEDTVEVPAYAGRVVLVRDATAFWREGPAAEKFLQSLEKGWEPAFPGLVRRADSYNMPQAAVNSLLALGGVFCVYALVTGPLVWIIFRKRGRRALAIYTLSCIGVFSVILLLAGPVLEMRRGVLGWLTVTRLTLDGGVQQGLLTCYSTGGKGYRLSVAAEKPRGWLLSREEERRNRYYYYRRGVGSGYRDMVNLAFDIPSPGEEGAQFPSSVPVSPWGCRQALFFAVASDARALPVELRRSGAELSVKVRNTLPVRLSNVRVLLGAVDPARSNSGNYDNGGRYRQAFLGDLSPGMQHEGAFGSPIYDTISRSGVSRFVDGVNQGGNADLGEPIADSPGKILCCLVAEVEQSPGLTLKDCDFVATAGIHYVVQRIEINSAEDEQALLYYLGVGKQLRKIRTSAGTGSVSDSDSTNNAVPSPDADAQEEAPEEVDG